MNRADDSDARVAFGARLIPSGEGRRERISVQIKELRMVVANYRNGCPLP
jgi:hypothetical protein